MKTITIPKSFGYPTLDIVINNAKHTLRSGEEITVDDHIAEVIENAIALAPKYGRAGGKFAQLADGSLFEITASDLEGITKVRASAFYSCKSIEKVEIPNNINDIESHAFYGCNKLERVTIGNGVMRIAAFVFDGCAELTSVYLPKTPPVLANANAFQNINSACVFYCKTQASLDAYKAATNWSTLTGTYTFKLED